MKTTLKSVILIACLSLLPLPSPAAAAASKFDLPATDEGLPGAGPIRRYDWFRNLWSARRNAWSQRVAQDQGALVFLGDSITQGWGDTMGGSFPGVKVANRGISGDTTRGVLIRLREDVLSLNPSGVVLLIGTNDLEENAEPETIAANLKLILAELKQHNAQMPVILCEVFPSSASKKRPSRKIRKVNELYAAAVKGDSQVTLVQTWPLFANPDGDAKPEEFPDLLHPNKLGYAKWADALRPVLASAGLPVAATADGFRALFNGRDFTGWEGNTNVWRVRDRAIVGGSLNGNPRNEFLATTRPYTNFVLRLDYKLVGTEGFTNGGVQIRSQRITNPPNEMSGYQADIESGWSGSLYDESRRNKMLAAADKALVGRIEKHGDWNRYEIRCEGRRIQLFLNGERTVDYTEPDATIPQQGLIALQIHGDNKAEISYRNIDIRELGGTGAAAD